MRFLLARIELIEDELRMYMCLCWFKGRRVFKQLETRDQRACASQADAVRSRINYAVSVICAICFVVTMFIQQQFTSHCDIPMVSRLEDGDGLISYRLNKDLVHPLVLY